MLDNILKFIEKNLRRKHTTCPDEYYDCPKAHPQSTALWECDCGAEVHNKKVNELIEMLKEEFIY